MPRLLSVAIQESSPSLPGEDNELTTTSRQTSGFDSTTKKSLENAQQQQPHQKIHHARATVVIGSEVVQGSLMAAFAYYVLNEYLQLPYFWISMYGMLFATEMVSPATNALLQFFLPIAFLTYNILVLHINPSLTNLLCILPVAYFLIGIPMSVCLHRYFAHASFRTSRPFQALLGVVACLAYQGGPLWWSGKHTRHHFHCDQESDPHSAVQRGMLFAFVGWTVSPASFSERDMEYVRPHLLVPELKLLDQHYMLPVMGLFHVLERYFEFEHSTIVLNAWIPMLLCRLITLFFNVDFHPAHKDGRCKSINNRFFLSEIVGESMHDVHHKIPNQSKRSNMDMGYWLSIFWMNQLGLVWDCR